MSYKVSNKARELNEKLEVFMEQYIYPREKDADNWWADEGYQDLSKHRRAVTDITLQRLKGLPPRG